MLAAFRTAWTGEDERTVVKPVLGLSKAGLKETALEQTKTN
jgi:hypothetical protein